MAAALYHPRYGYYARVRGFGADGDFITSPETHRAFGALLARQIRDVQSALGRPEPFRILELGGGSAALARAVVEELPDARYTIFETSPTLRQVQRARLKGFRVSWRVRGTFHVILANEVLDAQPVHRVVVRNGELRELRVGMDQQRFAWVETEVSPGIFEYFAGLGVLPPEGAVAEVNLRLPAFSGWLADHLDRGLALILDYGYVAEDLFSRAQGTLLTYYRHTMGSDPLVRLGEQDISTHVDFTTLASSAHAAGLEVAGVTSQRALLRALGIEAWISSAPTQDERRALVSLIDPYGLGRIGVLFLSRGLPGYAPIGLGSDQGSHAE